MPDPSNPGEVSVTLKCQGKDAPWIVFKGSVEAVTENVRATIEGELFSLVVEAGAMFNAVANAGTVLGARHVGSDLWESHRDAPTETPASAPVDPVQELREAISKATSTDALVDLWTANEAAFSDEGLLADWKAKGQSLSAA